MSMIRHGREYSGNGKNRMRIATGTALMAVSLLFTSCPREIGLGSAVDTQKPFVSITSPEVDAVIKDVITFRGKATDETGLDSVTVTFQSTETTYSKSYSAEIDKSTGTWSLTINTEDPTNGLPDYKYEATATAKDRSGKTSSASRSFQLDNSAPTILVTKPSTFGGNETVAFYKQVEIKGETYDASSVKEVRVGLYKDDGTLIKEKIADGTDSWSTVFYPDDFMSADDVKSRISSGEFHPVYIYVKSTDKADNTSTYYYHKSDMYSILSGKKGSDSNIELYFPTTTQIGTLDMGRAVMTVTGINNTNNDSVSYDVSQEELHGAKHFATSEASFSTEISASTYPYLYYTDESTATIEWNNFDAEHPLIGLTSDILGSIQPPSDGSSVILDTLKVWFVKPGYAECLEYSAGEFAATRMGEAVNLTINADENGISAGTYDMYLFGKTNSGTTIGYDYDPNVTPNFTPNNGGYVKDLLLNSVNINIDDSVMYPQDQATGTVYPDNVTTADVWYVKGDFNLPVNVTGLNASTVVKLKIPNAINATTGASLPVEAQAPAPGYSSLTGTKWQVVNYTNTNQDVSLKYKVDLGILPEDSPVRIIYSAEDVDTITKQIYVQRDEKAPELTISTTKSIFTTTDLTSGNIRLSGTVLDLGSGLKTLQYALLGNDGSWSDWHDCSVNSSSWTADIDPGSEGKKTIRLRAADNLGNVKETLDIGQGDDTELHDIVVFYDNNLPEITVNINDGDKICADFTLEGKAWDSDCIDEITVSTTVGGATKTWSSKASGNETAPIILNLIAATKPTFAAVTANNWKIDFKTGTSNSSEATYIDDGTKLITIIIKDIAGNSKTITRSITLDTVAPVITQADGDGFPLVDADENGTAEARIVLKDVSPYAMLKIHASDNGTSDSGLEGVYYQITDGDVSGAPDFDADTESNWTAMAQGSENLWTANVDFSGVTADTEKKAWIAAKDRAGNRVVYQPVPADPAEVFIVKVDQQKPVLSLFEDEDNNIEIPTFTDAVADVKLYVRVTDTNPNTPEVSIKKGSGTAVAIPAANITEYEDGYGYSVYEIVLPFASESLTDGTNTITFADGTYTIKITEADLNGRPAAQVTHSILRDKTSPVITLSNYTSASWIAVDTIALSGSVKEANLAKLEAWFVYTDNSGTTVEKDKIDITDSVGNADTDNNRAFTWRQYELPEGTYVAHVKATDKSNRTHEVTSGDIVVDKAVPSSTLLTTLLPGNESEYELFATSGERLTASGLTNGDTYLANTGYTLSGVITELNLDTATLTVTKDGTTILNKADLKTAVEGRNTWNASTQKGPYTWSFKQIISDTDGDGTYVYTLEIKDKSNNRTSYTLTVKVDSTAPALTITTPGANQPSSLPSMTIRGEVEDAGAGVAQVHYSYVDADDNEKDSGDAVINGNTWSKVLDFTSVGEGAFTLKVKAKDKLGNECTEQTVEFSYDKAAPGFEENIVGNNNTIKTGDFTLGGKAWDSNLIKEITVSTSVAGTTKTWSNLTGETEEHVAKIQVASLITADGITAGKKASKNEVADNNWEITFKTGNTNVNESNFIADGTNYFTIVITDIAGKTYTDYRTVTVDTTLPSLSLGEGEGFASTLVEKDVSPFVTLKVTADDPVQTKTDGSAITGVTATGLAGVYYQITANIVTTAPDFATTADEANWTAMAQASDGWTANVNFSGETGDVTKTAWIAAKDRAGNRIVYPSGDAKLNVNIDQHKPVLSVQSGATFSNQSADLEIVVRVADTNPTNPSVKVYKPMADSSAVGNVANPTTEEIDFNDGVVTLLESHTTEAEPYADYKIVIPFCNNASKFNGDGYYTVLINEIDEKSRAASQVAHIVLQDTSAPSLELTSNTEDVSTNNTTLIVTGTVSDANLVKVEAWLDSDSDHKEDITSAVTADGTFTWKKYGLTEGEHYVHVIATDAADLNKQVDSAKIIVDTTVPTSTLLQSAQKLYTTAGAAVPVADELTVNTTYLAKEGFTLTGVIDEAHLKSAKITVTKDDGTPVPKNLYSLSNGFINAAAAGCTYTVATKTWTCAQTAVDGIYVYKLDLEDDAGNQKSYSFTVKVDKTAPTVTVITPGANESFVTTTPVFKGTASDEGSGLKKVYYTYGDDPEDPTTSSSAVTLSGGSWTQSMNFAGAGEGVFKFKVMAEDALGLTSTVQTITYSYDLHNPELTETGIGEAGLSTNANFSLSGKAWDSNAIDEITITGQGKTWSSKAAAGVTAPISVDISAGKKPTFAEVTADNWSINFKVGSSNSTEATYIADGTTTFTITIKDVAGKSRSYTRTVSVDTTAPVLSRLATDGFATNPVKQDESPYSKLSVQATDTGTGATGLEGVWYKISGTQPDFDGSGAGDTWADIAAGNNGWTSMAQGTSGWTANVDFSVTSVYSADGEQKAWFAAKDRAGNRAFLSTPSTTVIDLQKPVLSVEAGSHSTDASSNIDITVRVTDTNPMAPTVKVLKPRADGTAGGTELSGAGVSILEADTGTGYKEFTVTVPFNTTNKYTADGTYTLQINANDVNGRAADQITWTILQDKSNPEVWLDSYTSPTFTSNRTLTVTGAVRDDNLSSVIAWLNDDVAGAEDITALLGQKNTDSTSPDYKKQTFTWKQYDLTEGTYVVHIKATDSAGRVNADDGLASAVVTVDLTAPDSDFNYEGASPDDKLYTNTGTPLLTNVLAGGGNYFAKTAFTLKGTITEENFLEATLAITKDAVAQPSQTISSAGDWEYVQLAEDGVYVYTLTVKDKANNVFEKSLTVTVDTSAPSVTVITPAANESFVTTGPVFKGTASDGGAGLKTIYYTLDGTTPTVGDATATPAVPASPTATLAGGSWTKTMDFTGASEGVFSFKVMAEDILGNTSPIQTVTYSYDLHDPELSETGIGDSGLSTNADFSFSGKAWDSNAIDEIVISAGTKTWSSKAATGVTAPVSLDISAGTKPTFAEVTADNWNIDFKVGSANSTEATYIADGTTTFTITIKDVAGKSRSYTRTVTVDTAAPTITKNASDGFVNALVEQDVSPYNRLTIHASDAGAGLEGVWYQISDTEPAFASDADEADWTAMAQGTAGWTANVDFSDTSVYTADGEQKAWIAAKDRVGNRAVYAAGGDTDIVTFLDIMKPVLSVTSGDNFTDATSDLDITVRVTDTNPSAPTVTVVKPRADGTAGGDTIPDDDDGVSIVEGTVTGAYREYTVSVPYNTSAEYTADGTWTLKIDGTDQKGRAADQITWTVLKDQTPPEVELTSYTTATFTSNRTLTVTGTVKDDNLATVIAWLNDNEAGAEDITNLLGQPNTDSTSPDYKKQTFTWKQYDLTEGPYVVHIKATDSANLETTEDSAVVTVDITVPDSDFKYEGASADDKFYTNTGSALLTDVLSAGGTYFAKSVFTLKGTITETNFQEATLAITKDAVAQPSQTITSAGDWEYTQAADDGIYGYTLTVKDKANNVFEKSLTVTVDTLAPTVLVITPAANESFVTTDPVFKGTASDSGAGLRTIYYTLDGTEPTVGDATATPAVPASPTATLAGGSWTKTMDFTGASEGVFSFKVMSEDILGNTSAVQTVTYSYDLHDPELSETGVGDNGLTTNTDFSFSGTAWDSNAIDEILISTGTKKWSNKEVDGKIYVPSIITAAGITAGTKPTFAEVTADNWGITFKVGSGNSSETTYIADGTTTFTITITDVAGKSRSYTRTVTVDTTTPVITEETGDGFQNALVKQDESPYNKLTVHASDTGSGATGLDGVFYQVAATKPDFDDAADEADWTPMAQGTGGAWSANVDFSDTSVYAANGEQLAWIAAKDRAGNRVVYNNSISTFIDIMKPVLSIEKIDPSAEIPTFTDAITDLEFRVRVTDTNPLAPTIAVKDKDNNTIADAGISIVEDTAVDGSAGYKDWKVTVPFNSQAGKYTTDGDYTFTIEGKDTKDRVADPKTHTILRDTTDPEVTVAITQSTTTPGYSNQGTITATGTVSDANLTEVQAVLIKNEVVDTTTQETITSSLGSGGTFTWKKYELDDGKYKVRVSGKDRADLVGYGFSDEVIIDKTAPETSFTWDTTGDVKLYDNTGAEVTTLTAGGSYMAKSAFTLKGVVSEANLKKVDYTTSKDGETPAGENIYSDDGLPIVNSDRYDISNDTWNIVQAATDGTYVYTLKIEDKAGNRSEQSITILVDTAAPELVITKPAEDEQLEQGTFKFAGTVSDQGSGVNTVTYVLKNAGTEIKSGNATRTGGSWTITEADGTGLSLGAEGALEIEVTAKDKLGQSTTETTTFYYDQGAPTLEETEVGVGSLITGATFTLKGTASDSNALAGYDSGTGTAAGAINISTGTGPDKVDYGNVDVTGLTTATAAGNWEKTFTPGTGSGELADGTYTFYIKATDVSGRDTTVQRTVVIDTTAPEINNIDGKDAYITQSASFNWFNSGTISIGAKVTDNRAGGVASVEYAVISNPSAEPDASAWGNAQYEGNNITWKSMTKSGSNYTANAEVEDGKNYIVIRAKDAADNVTYSTQEFAKVDTTEPSLVGAYEERACTTEIDTIITNAGEQILVFIKTEDSYENDETQEVSEVSTVVAKIGSKSFSSGTISTTNVASNVFRLTLSTETLEAVAENKSSKKVYVKMTDTAGNESSATSLFTLQFDTEGPESEFMSPADGATVNKKISINGKSNDLQGLDSVSLFYLYNDTDMSHKQQIGETKTGMDAANWSYTFDTAPLLDHVLAAGEQSALTLIAEATDSAGNTSSETITLRVDQSEDIPEVTITQPETLAGMSSSTPVWLKGNNRISGTIADDDGVSSLKISTDGGTSWTNIPVSGGYFQATLSIDDTYTVLFRVTDTAEGVFTSGETGLTALKMKDSSDPAVYSTDGKLYLTIDTENPQMLPTRYALDGSSTTASDWTMSLLAETTFGGTANTEFTIKQYAYDENGIKKVEVSIDGGAFVEATKQASDTTTDAGDTYTAWTYTVDTTVLETSLNHTAKVKVTDNADMTTELTSSFKVDNDEPTVTLGSHAEEERVHGTLFISGTTQDAPLYGPATSMLYKVTLTPDVPTDWTTTLTTSADYGAHTVTGNLGSWRIYFDDDINNLDGYTHDRALKKILVQLRSSELEISTQNNPIGAVVWKTAGNDASGVHHNAQDLYTSLTMMYLHMKATDAYGNVAYFVRALELDPQGDIPTISVAYPSITGYGWKNGSNVIYTAAKLPNVGDSVYTDIANMETAAGTISAINRTAKTITYNGTTYTNYGGETVQGGTVRVQGTADGQNAIKGIFMQIDPAYNATTGFNWNASGSALMPNGEALSTKYTIEPFFEGSGEKGIKIGEGVSWSVSLNRQNEFNGASGSQSHIGIRLYAVDTQNNVNPLNVTDDIIITIDSDSPLIGSSEELYLYQYENNANGTGNVVASQKYEDDMWLKGEWWIQGSIEDASGINADTVSVQKKNGSSFTDHGYTKSTKSWYVKDNDGNDTTTVKSTGYVIKFKIGSAGSGEFGKLVYQIAATDKDTGNAKHVEKLISINFDNAAPVLAGTNHEDYNINHEVVQSNGFYTLGSSVTETGTDTVSQSGFERLALYFVRPGSTEGTSTLYDTYFLKSSANNHMQLSTLTYSEGLYWKSKQVARDPNNLSAMTLYDGSADPNIHKGGLVKIGGTIYVISSVSGTAITVKGSPAIANTSTMKENVEFAMGAIVVDHALTEGNGTSEKLVDGYYTDVQNDDGDNIVERVTTQGYTSFWEANICSRNIPDGAIDIHYVAFDKAGNYAIGVVASSAAAQYKGHETPADILYDYDAANLTRVANNAPRLAGVMYGTDDDGSGVVEDDEMHSDLFAISTAEDDTCEGYVNSGLRTSYLMGTKNSVSVIKIKGATRIQPEIVGGNGTLGYSWTVTQKDAASPYYSIGYKALSATGSDYSATGAAAEIKDVSINLSVKDLLKNDGNNHTLFDGVNQLFSFTIWDSTDGMTPGTNSQKATIEMVADLDLQDDTPPNTYIKPFYWKSKSDNSVYIKTENGKSSLMGHIDLKADLPAASFSQASGVNDTDDKVSGTIVIEGTAQDNVLLKDLYVQIYTGTTASPTEAFGFGSLSKVGGTGTLKNFYKVAHNNNGTWESYGTNLANGWTFSVDAASETFSQEEGHTIAWKLVLDTEELTSAALSDVKVVVRAQDQGAPELNGETISYSPNTSAAANTNQTAGDTIATQTNYNKFDVVPYITGVSTRLSSLKKNNPTIYNRTSLGKYAVAAGETVIFTGFNLTGAKVSYSGDGGTSASTTAKSASDVNDYYKNIGTSFVAWTIPSTANSGDIKLTVNSIPSLNNINNNNAKGAAVDEDGNAVVLSTANYDSYAYNRQPNGDSNLLLTDDVIFDIWSINTRAAVARDGGALEEPVMKINPKDGSIGLSFASGADSFCMPKGTGNTYTWWSTNYANFSNIALAYDNSGNAWSIGIGLDTNSGDGGYGGRMALMSSLWGRSDRYDATGDNFYTNRKIRLESIGLPQNAYAYGVKKSDYQLDPKRFSSTDLVVTEHGSGQQTTRGFYLAYYDRLTGQIRFRSGSGAAASKADIGQFIDAYGISNGGTTAGDIGNGNMNYNNQSHAYETATWAHHRCFEPVESAYSLIAGAESKDTTKTTGFTAGNFVALDVIPGETTVNQDVVLVAFYDGADLWYVTRTGGVGTDSNVNKNEEGTYWSKPVMIFEGMGQNCTIKAGPDGSVHIACYDQTEGSLRYAYMSSAGDTDNIKTATIDGYGITGSNISIDVVKEGTAYIPYISYYVPSIQKVKMAYLADASALTSSVEGALDGSDDNDSYTGVWECAIVPTASKVNDDNTSIGFWKNTDNTAQAIKSNMTATAGTGSGNVNGNGTTNPAIAYATTEGTSGYVEVVQKR